MPKRLVETPDTEVVVGDCLRVMTDMEPDSFDSVVTDPPYGLVEPRSGMVGMQPRTDAQKASRRGGFMGKAWDSQVPGVPFWSRALPLTKPGGYLLAMGGSRTYHRLTCAIEDAGWEIRDCIMWMYGTGFPKGKGCLKPCYEPIVLARKPGPKVLPLGIDECRVPANGDKLGGGRISTKTEGWDRPWKHDEEAVARCRDRGEASVAKAESLGRWPANLCHDGSEEVLEAFAEFGESKSPKGIQKPGVAVLGVMNDDGWKPRERTFEGHGDTGTAARFFYCAKSSKAERGEGNGHPTVKPIALMRWLVRLVTPPGGRVLDPFCGSGSTLLAAREEGRRSTGIEISPEYAEIAKHRLGIT